ncbi:MAG TPA: TrmH family RNA methyltransferase [Spirochaetaceae bacterium]|nr:TrmH family RNA methyltransferase [Spirochaetaceae bacterium]HBO40880.1 TrmH family RNA methyltransferase [Spirochaetaceae bacterium]HCQ87996.1 TrmH family RNA methyltransferase [Spirochaetaceae bacterium]
MSLSPGHRQRKAAQTLARIEETLRRQDRQFVRWLGECGAALALDPALEAPLQALAGRLADLAGGDTAASGEELVRAVNRLRRSLEAAAGVSPSDWDFADPSSLALDAGSRRFFPGVRAYLDDVRSPFNVGSIFRTADAFGVAELLLSPFTADPAHPRASRSAMGATAVIPWRRQAVAELPAAPPGIALELRGQNLDDFEFPECGVVFIGSEELGVSPEGLSRCAHRVSIPMLGAKGSLNVGVAFGVFMNAWRAALVRRGCATVQNPCRLGTDGL